MIHSAISMSAGATEEKPFTHCFVTGKNVTKSECIELTSDSSHNKTCIGCKCPSPYKACPSCLRFGDIKVMGHITTTSCEKRNSLCSFHIKWGYDAHRSDSERKEDIAKHLKNLEQSEVLNASSQKFDKKREKLHEKQHTEAPVKAEVNNDRLALIKQGCERLKSEQLEVAHLLAAEVPTLPTVSFKETITEMSQVEIEVTSQAIPTEIDLEQEKVDIFKVEEEIVVLHNNLPEKDENNVSLLQAASSERQLLEEQVLQLQMNLSVAEQSLTEQKSCNISLQIQNMQLQRDFIQMQDWLWKILGKRDCLHEIILDLESELRATTTAILNQQKLANLEKEKLLRRLRQLELPKRKEKHVKKSGPLSEDKQYTKKKSSFTTVEPENKTELVEIKQKPEKFKPKIWSLWGK